MRDITVEDDDFARGLEDILSEVAKVGNIGATEAVKTGIRVGARAWRKDARDSIGEHTYRRGGETITSGAYSRSIRSHMTDESDDHPAGEIGSPKLYGLTHLLELGHARIGGGRVDPVLHLDERVAPEAFDAAIKAAERAIEEGLDDR